VLKPKAATAARNVLRKSVMIILPLSADTALTKPAAG
jgi:hypothetical protein